MAILKARENSSDTFKPVATMGVGNASQSQRGLMTAQDKVKVDTIGNRPSGETDTVWDKVDTLSNNETDIVEQSFLVFNQGTSAQYYSSTTDISKDGYVPIYVGYDLNQIGLHLYLLRMYKSTIDGKFYANWGLAAGTGGGLSAAELRLRVVYRKV